MSPGGAHHREVPVGLPAIGDVIAGKYAIEKVLGVGGMGVVFAAKHRHLDERVAIKLLLPQFAKDATIVARFMREATAASRIRGKHVARVIDVTCDGGLPYLVMELLDGYDLAETLESRGPLGLAETIDYLLQACEALAEAHAKGIVHRDLKPSNLFLARQPDGSAILKIVDFGISKFLTPDGADAGNDMSMTQTATVLGSPLYMSPEQLKASKAVDGRTDVWALGVIFHELLTGTCPFSGATLPEVSAGILMLPTPSLVAKRPDLPPQLDGILERWLAKKPEDRFPSVGDVAAALAPYGNASAFGARDRILERLANHGSVPNLGAIAPPTPSSSSIVIDAESSGHGATIAMHETRGNWTAPPNVPLPRARPSRIVALTMVLTIALVGTAAVATAASWHSSSRKPAVSGSPVSSALPAPPSSAIETQPPVTAPVALSAETATVPPTASVGGAVKPTSAAPAPKPRPVVKPPAQPSAVPRAVPSGMANDRKG